MHTILYSRSILFYYYFEFRIQHDHRLDVNFYFRHVPGIPIISVTVVQIIYNKGSIRNCCSSRSTRNIVGFSSSGFDKNSRPWHRKKIFEKNCIRPLVPNTVIRAYTYIGMFDSCRFFKTFTTFSFLYNFHKWLFFNIYILNVINTSVEGMCWPQSSPSKPPLKPGMRDARTVLFSSVVGDDQFSWLLYTGNLYICIFIIYIIYKCIVTYILCSTVVVVIPCTLVFRQLGYI